ncbi:protein-S-isoprenylcysteine O-methyltransferase Ste14 [Haloferula luteola]|uniref:Protein-S-isoprenylcysteine O-methyltransferase Ste14 n=1 Tax=Haloferula luteola TaxID=595692 RepID=A0A840V553_9BACT|nr:isoprenylcysteine carboxylmethyltransferase family protein [Haloferula luteola]MBB5350764.1 protein-S-isoprenylcysteine O-methyltransferase Ste14 [Haloferula luteola]
MKVRLGNFLYHYRNILFPLVYSLLFIKGPTLLPDYRMAAVAGFLIALSGQLLRGATVGLDYIKRGGKNRMPYADDLVTGGLFSHCRNPLYVGNVTILIGTGVASNSLLFMTAGLLFFFIAYSCIVAAEENFLRGKFGATFDDYCSKVGRFTFNPKGLGETLQSMRFNWRRLISAEYNSAFIWILAASLGVLQNAHHADDLDGPVATAAVAILAIGILGYVIARILKKAGRLRTAVTS